MQVRLLTVSSRWPRTCLLYTSYHALSENVGDTQLDRAVGVDTAGGCLVAGSDTNRNRLDVYKRQEVLGTRHARQLSGGDDQIDIAAVTGRIHARQLALGLFCDARHDGDLSLIHI